MADRQLKNIVYRLHLNQAKQTWQPVINGRIQPKEYRNPWTAMRKASEIAGRLRDDYMNRGIRARTICEAR